MNSINSIQEVHDNSGYVMMKLTVSDAMELAGNSGSYQVRAIFFGFLNILFSGFILKLHSVLFIVPKFECLNDNGEYFACSEDYVCTQSTSFRFKTTSIFLKRDFDIFCDKNYWAGISKIALVLGAILGALYYGWFIEKKGRKKAMFHSVSVYIFFSVISIFSPKIIFFIICYFIMSSAVIGYLISVLVYISEITDENLRVIGPMFIMFGFGLSRCLYAFVCFFVEDWKIVFGLLSPVPLLVTAVLSKNIVESPRYLVTKKNFISAKDAINYICIINGKKVRDFVFAEEENLKSMINHMAKITGESLSDIGMKQKTHSYLDIMKYKSIRIRTAIIVTMWFTFHLDNSTINSIFYDYTKNPFFNVAIVGCFSAITALISMGTLLNYERKKIIRFFLLIVIISNILFPIFISTLNWESSFGYRTISILLMLIAKLFVQMSCHVLLIYTLELYPTSVRHFSLAFFYAGSYLGNIISLDLYLNKAILIYVICIIFIGLYPAIQKMRETFLTDIRDNLKEEENALTEYQYSFRN